jgi:hypothetical protein
VITPGDDDCGLLELLGSPELLGSVDPLGSLDDGAVELSASVPLDGLAGAVVAAPVTSAESSSPLLHAATATSATIESAPRTEVLRFL